jgi:hypothetical protein
LSFLGEALRPALTEHNLQMLPGRLDGLDWILGDDTAIVFHFHVQLIVRQDPLSQLENFRETAGVQPMLRIPAHMGLEQNRLVPSGHPTAVDEALRHVADFRDVGMGWDKIAIRQNKPGQSAWMLFERQS